MLDSSTKTLLRLQEAHAYRNHGVLPDGSHVENFFITANLSPHGRIVSRFGREIAELFEINDIAVVVAPTPDEIILAQWVAFHLEDLDTNRREVLVLHLILQEKKFLFLPEHKDLLKSRNSRTLIVRNALFPGDSTDEVIKCVKHEIGDNLIGLGAIVDYGLGYDVSIKHNSLAEVVSHHISGCPVCAKEFWQKHLRE